MTLWAIFEVILVSAVLVNLYLWKTGEANGAPVTRLNANRRGVLFGTGLAVLILIRLVTHTHH